jgi:hypothetical protein
MGPHLGTNYHISQGIPVYETIVMSNHFLNEYICVVYLIKIDCFVFLYMLIDCRHAVWKYFCLF